MGKIIYHDPSTDVQKSKDSKTKTRCGIKVYSIRKNGFIETVNQFTYIGPERGEKTDCRKCLKLNRARGES